MIDRAVTIAKELLSLPTAPFSERAVADWIQQFVAARPSLEMIRGRLGNILVRHPGRRARRPLVFVAHMDHPGFTVTKILPRGRVFARWDGYVPAQLFKDEHVRFHSEGRWVRGKIVDVELGGYRGRPLGCTVEVKESVAIGSVGMWDFPDPRIRGNLLVARGCDDVAGSASLVAFLDQATRRGMKGEFFTLFTRAEEAGFIGATAACEEKMLPKDALIISVETSKAMVNARQGDGPIVRVGDRVTAFTPAITDYLTSVAEGLAGPSFRFQRKLMDGGICEASVFTAYGCEAGGLCIALGNYHNIPDRGTRVAPETIDLRDYRQLIKLYGAVVENFGEYGKQSGAFKTWCSEELGRRKRDLTARTEN